MHEKELLNVFDINVMASLKNPLWGGTHVIGCKGVRPLIGCRGPPCRKKRICESESR